MKQYWQRLSLKIDALTLRERTIIFAMAALILITLINTFLLDPLYAKQKQLSLSIRQEQAQIAAMQAEIQQRVSAQTADPDNANKIRLQQLEDRSLEIQNTLRDMQKGLVSPDKMPALLDDILKQHGKLRLVSLKTLPPSELTESPQAGTQKSVERAFSSSTESNAQGNPERRASEGNGAVAIFRHGVEMEVQGRYFDILDYMAQLETMQWHLFWGKATLKVNEYPNATLTLTLYTLSLDKKWLNI